MGGALMADEETQEFYELLDDEQWEERNHNLLLNSKIDQDFAQVETPKNGRKKKHKISLMKKRPTAIPSVILELQNQLFRESSLRCLSNFLLEKREEDPENYERTGYFLYDSCSTMAILLQEVLVFSQLMADESLTVRASKRLINVLTLYQCIAANKETRHKFAKSFVPNFLVPVILFESSMEIFENVRVVALSVIGILCQAREAYIIRWAIQSEIVQICLISIEIGNELCKVIGMHIVEAILLEDTGISYVCKPSCDCLLNKLMMTLEHLVDLLASDQDFSPRLLFHVIRCYFLLCNHARGLKIVMERLPNHIFNGSFDDIAKEFPVIGSLLQQLLLTISKTNDCSEISHPNDLQLHWTKYV